MVALYRQSGGIVFAAAVALTNGGSIAQTSDRKLTELEALGASLFTDRNLSVTRTQNCVSCHSPQLAFTDPRELGDIRGAVSRGAYLKVFGDRNSPTLTYVGYTPEFHLNAKGEAIGGFFHDGRARSLEDQVGQPMLDPTEMAMPDKASIATRLKEKPQYVASFQKLFGPDALGDERLAFSAMSKALAAFLRTVEFSPFDSRYDRVLSGLDTFTEEERAGRDLFFGKPDTGCASCHSSGTEQGAKGNTFTTYRYVNLGTPANTQVRALNSSRPGRIDHGLMATSAAVAAEHDGKFKVPTLRNVALTGPYMHNGVFQDLRTVIKFHLRMTPGDRTSPNPETGRPWEAPEVAATVDERMLRAMPNLSEQDIQAVVAFLATLTDRRFERLLAK